MYFWPIVDLLSGTRPKPIFDLFLGYPNSSGDFGGLGGHLNLNPWWTFRIFLIFFSARGSGKGSPRSWEGGGRFFIENPRRVGVSRAGGGGGRGAGRVFAGNLGGGGAKYFFFGAEIPTKFPTELNRALFSHILWLFQQMTTCNCRHIAVDEACDPFLKAWASRGSYREPPNVGLAPTALWRVPPSPCCNWRTLPSIPGLALFRCSGREPAGWRGGGVRGRREAERESPPSSTWGHTHIWGHSISWFSGTDPESSIGCTRRGSYSAKGRVSAF